MRLFIAMDVPIKIRERLAALRQEVERAGARGRWTKPQSMHLTLKFLGETDESRVPEITAACEKAAAKHQAFMLKVSGLGAFPHLERPRILWAGVSPLELLRKLHSDLEENLEEAGFARDERSFNPHLTILRLKSRPHRENFARLVTAHRDTEFGQFSASEVILFQSLLKPDGAEYNVLSRVALAA